MGENPCDVCHNNSANTFPEAVLKGKEGAVGCKIGQCSVRCNKNPQNWHSVREAYVIQGKVGKENGREPPEGKGTLLSPYYMKTWCPPICL
jgi:hypothetical protein